MKTSYLEFKRILMLLLSVRATMGTLSYSQSPSISGYNVYYGHLHNHTSLSDGKGSPADAYTHARDVAGLDFMGLSEHGILLVPSEWNKLKNAANEYNQDGRFVTFWGFEWSSNLIYGHLSIINTEEYTTVLNHFSFSDINRWLSQREGVAFFNHPGREDNGTEFEHFDFPPSEKFVGMELWNKGTGFDEYYYNDGYHSNDGGKGYYDEALSRGWKIGASGAHDHHSTSWGETPRAMAVLAQNLSRDEIYAALKAKRFFSTEDRGMALSVQIAGQEMGATLRGSDSQALRIQTSDKENETFSRIELYKNGTLYYYWTPSSSSIDIHHQLSTKDGEYYYVKVTQEDGDEAISSPIFISGNDADTAPEVSLISPIPGGQYTEGSHIELVAEARDKEGPISSVAFYDGNQKIGETTSEPYRFVWKNAPAGEHRIVAKATDSGGNINYSALISIQVEASPTLTISIPVRATKDDAEEGWSSIVYDNSSDLELVYDSWLTGNQKVGLRFQNLSIPQGALIQEAYLQFTCDETGSKNTNITIRGESSDDTETFSSANKISKRPLTVSQVPWKNIPAWNAEGEAGPDQRTPDLKEIVQEIINRPGWMPGNAMAFILSGEGKRTAEAYDGDADKAPKLIITYSTTKSSTPKMPSFHEKTGTEELLSEITIFPNPFTERVYVQPGKATVVSVLLYDAQGQHIRMTAHRKNGIIELNTAHLDRGIYILSIETKEGMLKRRLIKD